MNDSSARQKPTTPLALPETDSIDLDSNQVEWQDGSTEGFQYKLLLEDPATSLRTYLMKVDAGAFSPPHAHDELEQVYVLEGSFYDQHRTYRPGEYIVRAPGAMHSGGSENGAVVLLFYSPAKIPGNQT